MRGPTRLREAAVAVWLCVVMSMGAAMAQQSTTAATNEQLQEELKQISTQLAATQQQLEQSQQQVKRLQQEMEAIQARIANGTPQSQQEEAASAPAASTPTPQENAEKIDVVAAQVKVHEQSKVESASKYPVKVTGLILYNTYVDKGNVDNQDLPSVAVAGTAGASNLTVGSTMRQTLLGVQVTGPHVFGAESSGEVNFDFYGGFPYTNYNTVAGVIRMRTAALRLSWPRDTVEAGFVGPLISPLEPTSYATVAETSMAWAGNLWTWAPQLSYTHRFGEAGSTHAVWQFGLWDPPTAGYNSDALFRAASPGERSGQPAYEARLALVNEQRGANGMQVGLGGYYSRQSYTGWGNDSWAVSGDWRLPVGRVFELSGEAYRGRSLGGLGGGAYKDVEYGTDPVTGAASYKLLNDAGGWAQAKLRFGQVVEANAAYGLDNAFARDFHALVLSPTASATQLRARNHMMMANLIYSPKTYLILSPEFRRIWTWPIYGQGYSANVVTMSVGVRF